MEKGRIVIDEKKIYRNKSVLIFNRPYVITDNNFYVELFRIPEVLNRLRQYREMLSKNGMNVPIWVYCLTQDIRSLTGSPQPFVLHFLIHLGLFDRWIARNGWPRYIVGLDSLMSVVTGEISFEEQALLLSNGYCQESAKFQLYQASSYYNIQTDSFCLTSLKKMPIKSTLRNVLIHLSEKFKRDEGSKSDCFFQMLAPHEESLMDDLKSHGIFPRDFLEGEEENLKWLWPIWKKTQMEYLKKNSLTMPR